MTTFIPSYITFGILIFLFQWTSCAGDGEISFSDNFLPFHQSKTVTLPPDDENDDDDGVTIPYDDEDYMYKEDPGRWYSWFNPNSYYGEEVTTKVLITTGVPTTEEPTTEASSWFWGRRKRDLGELDQRAQQETEEHKRDISYWLAEKMGMKVTTEMAPDQAPKKAKKNKKKKSKSNIQTSTEESLELAPMDINAEDTGGGSTITVTPVPITSSIEQESPNEQGPLPETTPEPAIETQSETIMPKKKQRDTLNFGGKSRPAVFDRSQHPKSRYGGRTINTKNHKHKHNYKDRS